MKNISIGIQSILAIAVLVLYILHFTQKSSPQKTDSVTPDTEQTTEEEPRSEESTTETSKESLSSNASSRFAYVNSDTLLEKYAYYQKIQNQLKAKRTSFENEFKSRQAALQKEALDFQKSIAQGTITDEASARQTQQSLMQKEQSLIQESQQRETYLIKEEQSLSKELNEKIADYLKRFAEKNGYEMIFSFSLNTMAVGVMHSDPSLNITGQVIKGLNDEYKAAQK